jgi:predicted patatin/cPLA2 family phospholipase
MGKGFKVLGQDISQDQQRKIAHLLLSEDKDLVTRALNSNKGWDQVQKRILQIQKSLEAGARRAPAPIAEELGGEGLSGLLF